MEIKHASHDHPLILTEKYEKNGEYHCYGCELPITNGPTYCCSECREFVLHKPCAELPQQIRHPFHPRHTLTLLNKKPFKSKRSTNPCVHVWCNACGKLCYGFIFRCERCDFDLDIGCASLVPTIRYGNHSKHLLTLFNKFYKKHYCESCRKPCADALVLRCVECNFNVHNACAKLLSKQIRHPFHPLHSLTLTDIRSTHACRGCNTRTTGSLFFCSCKGCPFVMCTRCASLVPTIKYEGHEHLLTLFDKISRGLFCSSCRKMCDDAFVFRCVDCNFSLHAKCLPTFPRTIKHKCHIDPLILTDTIVEDDGSGEFYCDACEKFRNPQHAVYYCAECEFVAHIGCVIDEVLPSLVAQPETEVKTEEASVKTDTMVEGSLGVTGEGSNTSSTVLPSEKVEIGDVADPALVALDEKIAKLQAEAKEIAEKLEGVEGFRALYIAFKTVKARSSSSEAASTLEEYNMGASPFYLPLAFMYI